MTTVTHRDFIPSLLLGGYRSFGKDAQRFPRFSTINLLIGPNNSGKSNVLRFIHEIYSKLTVQPAKLTALDAHVPDGGTFRYGRCISVAPDSSGAYPSLEEFIPENLGPHVRRDMAALLSRIVLRKAELDRTFEFVWYEFGQGKQLRDENWESAFGVLNDADLKRLWANLNNMQGGNRSHWVTQTLPKIVPSMRAVSVEMIPAIRQVGAKGTQSEAFDGEGLIERLARLERPDVHNQADKKKFRRIAAFLQAVTDNPTAEIEIPYNRDTILVHMDGRALPLESLGTGIHEVIILAAASTILEQRVICMEEPEIHLNPVLQRKLIRYLMSDTSNQYFIATHSAALMDMPDAEIYCVQLKKGQSVVDRVTSDRHRSAVCEDLGYHPSDLLLANCVIWVEGPSDRIYLAHWISQRDKNLIEGVHFSIMFYGGRLASHLSGNDLDEAIQDFISLRRLNRRAVMVIDSDRPKETAPLNGTKDRLVTEFGAGAGHAWVTAGREIENYLPPDDVKKALGQIAPKAPAPSRMGRYDKVLSIKSSGGKAVQAPKVEVAKYIVANCAFDENRFDLKDRLASLIQFIRDSNPHYERVAG